MSTNNCIGAVECGNLEELARLRAENAAMRDVAEAARGFRQRSGRGVFWGDAWPLLESLAAYDRQHAQKGHEKAPSANDTPEPTHTDVENQTRPSGLKEPGKSREV